VKKKPSGDDLLEYWKRAVGQYVRKKRLESKRGQKELSISRQAISEIENGQVNFTLGTLLSVLDEVGGDLSEAFQAKTPGKYKSPLHRELHDQLQELLEADPLWATAARINVEAVYGLYLKQAKK